MSNITEIANQMKEGGSYGARSSSTSAQRFATVSGGLILKA